MNFTVITTARQLALELDDRGKSEMEIAASLNRAGFTPGLYPDGTARRYTRADVTGLLQAKESNAEEV